MIFDDSWGVKNIVLDSLDSVDFDAVLIDAGVGYITRVTVGGNSTFQPGGVPPVYNIAALYMCEITGQDDAARFGDVLSDVGNVASALSKRLMVTNQSAFEGELQIFGGSVYTFRLKSAWMFNSDPSAVNFQSELTASIEIRYKV